MICPNCKTELVEVNGRYICSDCGREIPENEVMASDWGNGGTVRAGLYGAGTDEPDTSASPVAEYNTSLTESESEIEPAAVTPEPIPSETTEKTEEPTVEEVLQSQEPAEPVASETEVTPPVPDTGFYTAEAPVSDPVPVVAEVPTVPAPDITMPEPVLPPQEVVVPEATPIVTEKVVETVVPSPQEIPINIAAPEPEIQPMPTPEPIPETIPEHTEVVKDMFENTAATSTPDPGIYTDPMYDTPINPEQSQGAATTTPNAPISADKRMNMIVIIAGSVLTLLLVIGGTWGYLALNKKTVTESPTVSEEITWQELQSVDGGFKVNFPDQPETITGTQTINSIETEITNFMYQTDDITYQVGFSTLTIPNAKAILSDTKTILPKLVTETAAPLNLTVTNTKIGNYYAADSVDFTLTSDTASYQGKIMINGQKYIIVMAGSDSGQSTEYDKFIKSFTFITESAQ